MADIDQINLIPPDVIEQKRGWHGIRIAIFSLTILFFCIIIVFSLTYRNYKRMEQELSGVIAGQEKLRYLEKEAVEKYKNIEELQQRRRVLAGLIGKSYFSPILSSLSNIINPDIKLNSLQVANNGKKGNRAYNLTLSGIARSYQELSIFLEKLQENISFYDVILKESNVVDQKKTNVAFELKMNYQRGIL